MNPAPSAMKYFKYCRDHLRCATSEPPIRFAPAAVKPSSSASKIRVVLVDPIAQPRKATHLSPLITGCWLLVTSHSSLVTASLTPNAGTKSHRLPAPRTLFLPTAPVRVPAPPENCPPSANPPS